MLEFRKFPQGMTLSLWPPLVPWATWLPWAVNWNGMCLSNLRGWVSLLPPKASPLPQTHSNWGPQHPLDEPRRLHFQKAWVGDPCTELGNISKVLEDGRSGSHPLGALGTLVSVRKPDRRRLRGVAIKGLLLGCIDSTPIQQWDPSLLRLRGWNSSASQESWRE